MLANKSMNNKINIRALIILSIGLFIAASSGTFAAEKEIFLSPTRVMLSDQNRIANVNVTNLSDTARAYTISTEDLIMTYEGVTSSVEHFDYSAKRLLRYTPNNFILQPGERKEVQIKARIKKDTQDGEYHSHIMVFEDMSKRNEINTELLEEKRTDIHAPLAYETLIPIIISHGNIETILGLKNATVTKNSQTGNYEVSLIITRQGNGQGIAYIKTDYIAIDGTATQMTAPRTVYIYRELDERSKNYKISLPEGVLTGGMVRISFYDGKKKGEKPLDVKMLPFPK